MKNYSDLLIEHIRENGAFVHPDVFIRDRKGEFTVHHKKKINDKELIFQVPIYSMPNLNRYDIKLSAEDELTYQVRESIADLNDFQEYVDIQDKSLQLMLEIYNEANKVQQYAQVSPLLAFANDAKFQDAVRLRSENVINSFLEVQRDGDAKLYAFLESRVYQSKSAHGKFLLPVIDMMDHHSLADAFRPNVGVDAIDYLNIHYKNVANDHQIYASYFLMDAYHSWLKYGFVDQSAFFVQSVPFEIKLEDNLIIRVASMGVNNSQLDPKLWRANDQNAKFYAAQFNFSNSILDLSFLLIPPVKHINALDEVLGLYLTAAEEISSRVSGDFNNHKNIYTIKKNLVKANKIFYQKIYDYLQSSVKDFEFQINSGLEMVKKQMIIIKKFRETLN